MIQLTTDGYLENVISISGEQNMTGYAISADEEGNFYLGGELYGEADFDPGLDETILSSEGFSDAYIAKYNSNAELIWAKSLQSDESILCYSIDTDSQGNVFTSGYFETATDFDPDPETEFILNESPENATGAFVSVLDADGNFVNALEFGGVNFLDFHGVGVDQEDNIYAAGAFENTVDLNPADGIEEEVSSAAFRDNYIIKFTAVPTDISEMDATASSFTAFPIPATDRVFVEADNALVGESFQLFSLDGRMVKTGVIEGQMTSVDISNLETGIYILTFSTGQTSKVVKQ